MRKLLFFIVCFALVMGAGCANNPAPQNVVTVSQTGTVLMQGVQRFQQSLIDAEATGKVTRNQARTAMEATQKVGNAGQRTAQLLREYLNVTTPDARQTKAEQIQATLELINSGLVQALLPIEDPATRQNLTALVIEVQKTVFLISSQLLAGGVK